MEKGNKIIFRNKFMSKYKLKVCFRQRFFCIVLKINIYYIGKNSKIKFVYSMKKFATIVLLVLCFVAMDNISLLKQTVMLPVLIMRFMTAITSK